jgi:hypothetical protein
MKGTVLSPWEEHLFWIGILEDHAQFLIDRLNASETRWTQSACQYRKAFAALRKRLLSLDRAIKAETPEHIEFAKEAQRIAHGYRRVEGELQRLRMENAVELQLAPAHFRGTLLENEEYARILSYFVRGALAPPLPLYRLLGVWIGSPSRHAALLADHPDLPEFGLAEQARRFAQTFQAHTVKNRAIGGFLRFMPPGCPARRKFARDVAETVSGFYVFVQTCIRELADQEREARDRMTLRFLEHHLPEMCHLLVQLSRFEPRIRPPDDRYLWKPPAAAPGKPHR